LTQAALPNDLRPVLREGGREGGVLFLGSVIGRMPFFFYTLVQSARGNCVDMSPYLTDVLRRITAIVAGDPLALELCCRIAGWPPTPNIAWSSGKKTPAKRRPDDAGSGPLVGSP
jgi:hypothetical protein